MFTSKDKNKHFGTHAPGTTAATETQARLVLDQALNTAQREDDADDPEPVTDYGAPVVAVVHEKEPFTIVELQSMAGDGTPQSTIVSATVSSPAVVPDVGQLARLGGETLIAAPSCLPALLRALETNAPGFWTWFQGVCATQRERPEVETRLFTGDWPSLIRVLDNYAKCAAIPEANECLRLLRHFSDERDAALCVHEMVCMGLRWADGRFTVNQAAFGFSTAIAREAEAAVLHVLVDLASSLSLADFLAYLVHPVTAGKAKSALGVQDPAVELVKLYGRFQPQVHFPGCWSASDEFNAWFTFCVAQPVDWAKLAYAFPRVVLMSRATLLLGGPSEFFEAQLAKAWPLREQPAEFARAIEGSSTGKRKVALAEPLEKKRAELGSSSDDE